MTVVKLVLVADDYDDAARLLCEVIELETPCRAVPACNGREALEFTRLRHVDVAILDIEMPIMSGIEAARVMRAYLGEHRPLLVALSGRAADEAALSGLFDFVFTKPVETALLLGVLEAA